MTQVLSVRLGNRLRKLTSDQIFSLQLKKVNRFFEISVLFNHSLVISGMHLRKVEKKDDSKPSAAYGNDVASILKRRYTSIFLPQKFL